MKTLHWLPAVFIGVAIVAIWGGRQKTMKSKQQKENLSPALERFHDLQILRYDVVGFENLSLQQKELIYYLSQAALAGRDITWDQNFKHNLTIRRTLEEIVKHYPGDRNDQRFKDFLIYTKRVWFSNGIHHHYGSDKLIPQMPQDYFLQLVHATPSESFPTAEGESKEALGQRLAVILYDPMIAAKKVNLDSSVDQVAHSAVNFFEGLTQAEVTDYFKSITDIKDATPISYGLNTKLVKQDGKVSPQTYKIGGMYSKAIEQICYWLKKATTVAQSPLQREAFEELIRYYETGDLRAFDRYNILWVKDTESVVDAVNGFIETYDDPLGHTGTYESVVSFKDLDLTKKFGVLSHEAGWFEKNSPIDAQYKRNDVVGVSYKVITVAMESGASSPATPIGINLPNADWLRAAHGSKSVSLRNIEDAYDRARKASGAAKEFYLPEQQKWLDEHGELVNKLTTGLHEVVGHASGILKPGVGTPHETLKGYASTLEEARADLVALYFIGDQHLVDLGLTPSTDVVKAEYVQYMTNGLFLQLTRIEPGKNIEEAHMRNRQLIARWVYEHGLAEKVTELLQKDGKTYVQVNDFGKLRVLFGQLLREVQRIKSEGDYAAGKALVETYGVNFDRTLHEEVLARWKKLDLPAYMGFVNPKLTLVQDTAGKVTDVTVSYPTDFTEQMLDYAANHSFLPHYN